jgi:hypothetical protein
MHDSFVVRQLKTNRKALSFHLSAFTVHNLHPTIQ